MATADGFSALKPFCAGSVEFSQCGKKSLRYNEVVRKNVYETVFTYWPTMPIHHFESMTLISRCGSPILTPH